MKPSGTAEVHLEARGEFTAAPEAVIVHDPVQSGAFAAMHGVKDPDVLEREFLYRESPDSQAYADHHAQFVAELRRHVKRVFYLHELVGDQQCYELTRTNPNHVFTRDSLITIPWIPGGYIGARMKPRLRRQERQVMEAAARRLGLREIVRVPEELFLEGGDVIPFSREGRRTLLVGYGPRTMRDVLWFLQGELIPHYTDEIIGIELADYRMNLDGGFVPLSANLVVSCPGSIRSAVLLTRNSHRAIDLFSMLADLGTRVVEATKEESIRFQACNSLCLGGNTIIYYDLCPRVRGLLQHQGIDVRCVPGVELVKGRGGPRCMSRPIYAPVPDAAPPERVYQDDEPK